VLTIYSSLCYQFHSERPVPVGPTEDLTRAQRGVRTKALRRQAKEESKIEAALTRAAKKDGAAT
jgi:hypothetical protein